MSAVPMFAAAGMVVTLMKAPTSDVDLAAVSARQRPA
jgi:hypothetical protein